MSATMRDIRREQKRVQREVRQTKAAMDAAFKKEYKARLDATKAHTEMNKLRKKFAPFREKLVKAIVLKDQTTEKLNKIKSNLKSVAKTVAKPVVAVKDKATSVLSSIKSKMNALKVPITVAVTALITSIKGAAELEQQKISIEHFMGVNNKGKSASEIKKMSSSYVKSLRNNANKTPFSTAEVMAGGTRALQIESGNTKKAMQTLKLAEDMAALNPGKTVSDAMEALADAKMGEMERLKEFGYKGSSTDDPNKVMSDLQKMYAGGADNLSMSASGIASTIFGNLQTGLTEMGTGILNSIIPAMSGLATFMQNSIPTFTQVGQILGQGIGSVVSFLSSQMPVLGPIFQSVFSSMGQIVMTVAPLIGSAIKALWPIFVGTLSVSSVVWKGIAGLVSAVAPLVGSLVGRLSPIFRDVGSVLQSLGKIFNSVFNSIKKVVTSVCNAVKPVIESLGRAVSKVTSGISSVVGKVSGVFGHNATGTNYWGGGLSVVGEHGPEIVAMPSGSKVYTNRQSRAMTRPQPMPVRSIGNTGNNIIINIAKIAEKFDISSDMDINDIVERFVAMLRIALLNYVG